MNQQELINLFSKIRPSSTFLSIKEYLSSNKEISDFSIVFHISYLNALKKSLEKINGFNPTNSLEEKAKNELIASFTNSINNYKEENDDAYSRVFDEDKNIIKGIKIHKETNDLHIFGFINNKKVIVPGEYKKVKSSELTIVKNNLRNFTPVSKFRQFKLNNNYKEINVANLSIKLEE